MIMHCVQTKVWLLPVLLSRAGVFVPGRALNETIDRGEEEEQLHQHRSKLLGEGDTSRASGERSKKRDWVGALVKEAEAVHVVIRLLLGLWCLLLLLGGLVATSGGSGATSAAGNNGTTARHRGELLTAVGNELKQESKKARGRRERGGGGVVEEKGGNKEKRERKEEEGRTMATRRKM